MADYFMDVYAPSRSGRSDIRLPILVPPPGLAYAFWPSSASRALADQ